MEPPFERDAAPGGFFMGSAAVAFPPLAAPLPFFPFAFLDAPEELTPADGGVAAAGALIHPLLQLTNQGHKRHARGHQEQGLEHVVAAARLALACLLDFTFELPPPSTGTLGLGSCRSSRRPRENVEDRRRSRGRTSLSASRVRGAATNALDQETLSRVSERAVGRRHAIRKSASSRSERTRLQSRARAGTTTAGTMTAPEDVRR